MHVIISHKNTDFDGFASQVAASLLYPRARIVLSKNLERNVREFVSVYRSALPIVAEDLIDLEQIRKVIVVDTQLIERVDVLQEILQKRKQGQYKFDVVIYDHHTEFAPTLPYTERHVDEIGATTTLLVEEIKQRQIELNPLFATILGLGIYEDTGIFTFASTTYRDFDAVAYLMRQGLKLNVIMDFVNRELTQEQIQLLNELINNSESLYVKGVNIVFSYAKVDKYIVDISLVAHKLRDIENLNVLFLVIIMANKVHIIGRSRLYNVDVDKLLSKLGGGGHPSAASATLRRPASYEEVKNMIVEICKTEIKPRLVARDIMQRNFYIVDEDLPVFEAFRIMIMFNLDALPVQNKKSRKIVGLIRKLDVEKAFHHRLGHSPVKGYMSHKIVKLSEDASLEDIERALIENDIGLVFIVDAQDEIVGIVNRDILLRTMYDLKKETYSLYEAAELYLDNFRYLMEDHFPPEYLDLLHRIGYLAETMGLNAYIVGGVVRDMFLGVPNFDLDIVVEGKEENGGKPYGIILARRVAQELAGRLVEHERFKTAKLFLKNGMRLDFATARTEFYSMPAALPKVDVSSIKQDLYRRDFTINSMAIKINPSEFGKLYDFFNGLRDLKEKKLRVLYSLSFIDDPTRIFRAIRFEQRLGFRLDDEALTFLQNAIERGFLHSLASQRVRDELLKIFEEPNPVPAVLRMQELGILKTLDEELVVSKKQISELEQLTTFRAHYAHYDISQYITTPPWEILYIAILFENLSLDSARRLLKALCISEKHTRTIMFIYKDLPRMTRRLSRLKNPCRIYFAFSEFDELAFVYVYIFHSHLREKIMLYLQKLQHIEPILKGGDIVELTDLKPGPIIKHLINKLTCAQLDGKIVNKAQAINFVKRVAKRAAKR